MATGDPFAKEQRLRLERAVTAASGQTGMRFAVRIGGLDGDPAQVGETLLASLADPETPAVLVLVAPEERELRVLTTAAARRRLTDQACGLASLSMTTSFGVGDLVGGLANGLRMLAEAAGRAPLPTAGRPLPVEAPLR